MRTKSLVALIALVLSVSAYAFDPGVERICTPSADGQSFECRDKSGMTAAEITEASKVSSVRPAASVVAQAPDPITQAQAPTAASDVPNYLLQAPKFPQSTDREQAAPASASASASASVKSMPVSDTAATVEPKEGSPAPAPDTGSTTFAASPTMPVAPSATIEKRDAQEDSSAAPSTLSIGAERSEVAVAAPNSVDSSASNIGSVGDFLSLPPGHFTLVLASVRNARELDALTLALNPLPGQLYLLKLGMPDGDWYSLCWSQFEELDSARAARAMLPADAAITSGWPRRIGLLQKEVVR